MAGGRPPKKPSQKGINKDITLYSTQLNQLKICMSSPLKDFKTNRSELIRAAISLLEHFDGDYLKECIIDQRETNSSL